MQARALWYVGPGQVEVRAGELSPPDDGQVLVRTLYSGISAGTELLAYRGEIDPDLPLDETIGALGGTFRYPFRYGYSCVGRVEANRSELGHLDEGALVFALHPHQDRFVAAPHDLVPLAGVTPRLATLFPLVETALQITLDTGCRLEELVVVFGLGAVGLLTAVLLGRAGARVVGVEPQAWRRAVAADAGVDAVSPDDLPAALAARGAEHGVPLAVEVTGNPAVLGLVLPLLAHEGTVLVASWYGTKEVSLPLGAEFHRRRLTIRSTQVSSIPAHQRERWSVERRRVAVSALLPVLPLEALATHTLPFDRAPEAFAALAGRQDGLLHAALCYE